MERNNIYLGDFFDVIPSIPDKSVDMILCDLPYGITRFEWDDCDLCLTRLWSMFNRVCTGAIVLTAKQPFTSKLISTNVGAFKYEWIWEKTAAQNLAQMKRQPRALHEHVLVFCKGILPYYPIMESGTEYPSSVQRFPDHVALFEYMIKTYSEPGALVLDPCIGSGTTAIAAINTGREIIGIEKDEIYYDKAQERIQNHE